MLIVSICVLVSAAPAVVYQTNYQPVEQVANTVPELPLEAGNWLRSVASNDGWVPVYHGAVNQRQSYQKDNNEVVFYMGYYPTQNQGEELINDLNRISNNDVWRTVYPGARVQSTGKQQVLEQLLASSAKKQRLVWYWYNIAGNVTTNKYKAKIFQMLGLITGKRWAFVVAVAAQTDDDVDSTREVLKDFVLSIEKPMKKEMERVAERQ
jgi:EpsI family protein